MSHPRRSQQYRSIRPRRLRGHDRDSHSRRIYVNERGTLMLAQTRALLQFDREERVERAAIEHVRAEDALDASVCAWSRETAEHDACVARFIAAVTELKAAKAGASRPEGPRVTLEVTRLPLPRTWPNALPGGTSRHRAARNVYDPTDDAREDAWFIQRYAG